MQSKLRKEKIINNVIDGDVQVDNVNTVLNGEIIDDRSGV
jgi:hypothetical protein